MQNTVSSIFKETLAEQQPESLFEPVTAGHHYIFCSQ